jgi:eukaryotic-like serine/threonine-protein kinase
VRRRDDPPGPVNEPRDDAGVSSDTSWGLKDGAEIAPGRTVLRPLGGGSRYEVLLVWDDVRFAIMVAKVLRPTVAGDPDALDDLREEAEALQALSHPVILRGFDAVLAGPRPHLLVEHLEGPTLRRLLKAEGRLPLQQLIPLGLHVAAGLAYLDAVGWVHLDLKPDNLIMGVPPRIIDLSIARTVERAARTRGILGTDPYMAPEQCGTAEWEGRLGPPADIFGLAATLWRAATGESPFPRAPGGRRSEDPELRFPQLVAPPPAPPRQMPPALAELLLAGLARDPADRPSARELAIGFEPLLDALPVRARWGRGRR